MLYNKDMLNIQCKYVMVYLGCNMVNLVSDGARIQYFSYTNRDLTPSKRQAKLNAYIGVKKQHTQRALVKTFSGSKIFEDLKKTYLDFSSLNLSSLLSRCGISGSLLILVNLWITVFASSTFPLANSQGRELGIMLEMKIYTILLNVSMVI